MPIRDEPKASEPLYYLTYGSGSQRQWVFIANVGVVGMAVNVSRVALDASALTWDQTQTLKAVLIASDPAMPMLYAIPCDTQALIPADLRRIINADAE